MPAKKYINPHRLFAGLFIPAWLASRCEISSEAKLCYACLIEYAHPNGHCSIKTNTIAVETGLSSSVVQQGLEELVKLELLEIKAKRSKTKQYKFLNHHFIHEKMVKNLQIIETHEVMSQVLETLDRSEEMCSKEKERKESSKEKKEKESYILSLKTKGQSLSPIYKQKENPEEHGEACAPASTHEKPVSQQFLIREIIKKYTHYRGIPYKELTGTDWALYTKQAKPLLLRTSDLSLIQAGFTWLKKQTYLKHATISTLDKMWHTFLKDFNNKEENKGTPFYKAESEFI
jgi:DNA-binding transcriptional regulator GbsR (MarR family)